MDQNYSGLIMMCGCLVNGLSTALVGWLSDKPSNFILCR